MEKSLIKQFQKTYLELQRYLIHCLEWAGDDLEKKKEIKEKIKEVGEVYKQAMEKINKS